MELKARMVRGPEPFSTSCVALLVQVLQPLREHLRHELLGGNQQLLGHVTGEGPELHAAVWNVADISCLAAAHLG